MQGDVAMNIGENFDFESYAQSQQYQTDQTVFSEWQTRVYTNSEQLDIHFSRTYQDKVNIAAANDFSLSTDLAKTFTDIWQYNFDIMLGSTNPLFVDAERGIPNEHGVLIEVDDYGNPTYEEQIRTIEQREFLNNVTGTSVKDVQVYVTQNFESTSKQNLSQENEKKLSSPKTAYYLGFNAGINSKASQIPDEWRSLLKFIKSEDLKEMDLRCVNEFIKGLSADGIIMVPLKTEQGLSMIHVRDLEKRYNTILKTTNDFERGRLAAELFVDVFSVIRSDGLDISKLPTISNLPAIRKSFSISTDFLQKHPELLVKGWLQFGHNQLIVGVTDPKIAEILNKSGLNLTDKDLELIKQGSTEADTNYPGNNALHAMPEVGSLSVIKLEFEKNMQKAIYLERLGMHEEAMRYLGFSMHTVQDLYSHWFRGNSGNWLAHFSIDVVNGIAIPSPDNPNNNPDFFRAAGDATKVATMIFAAGKNTGTINEEMSRWIFGQ